MCASRVDTFKRTAKTDQTAWMSMLIRVFDGRTCYFIGFIGLQLKSFYLSAHVVDRLLHENVTLEIFNFVLVYIPHTVQC